jgi:N-acetylneuraminic acid mutarotase
MLGTTAPHSPQQICIRLKGNASTGEIMITHRHGRAVLFAASLVAAATAFAPSALAQGKWRSGAPVPEGANEVIGGTLDGQMFVYGGQDMANKPQGLFFSYDPAKNEWTKLSGNPVPVHHGAAAVVGHKFYVFGGFRLPDNGKVGWYPESKAWAYDADTKQWSALPNMPTARGALAAVAVDKKIYVIGGAAIPKGMQLPDGLQGGGPVELVGTTEVFDTATNTWSSLEPMPTPRNHHSVAYVDGKIYAIGGRVGPCFSNGWSSNIWMTDAYDIASNTWTPRAPMPTARSGTGIAVVDGKIHVMGGEGWIEDFGGVFRVHEIFDPKTNTWVRAPRMITPRHGFAATQIGKTIYTVSGVNNAGGAGTLSVVAVNEIFEE